VGAYRQGHTEKGQTGRRSAGPLPDKLKTALYALYKHYEETYKEWERAGIETPPVFIVVCNNTSTSKLVHEWISGWTRPNEDGEEIFAHNGHLKLFRNFDEHGNPFPRPSTGRFAVKVINHFGDEVMKVFGV
jgi:type III restriction enzyme